MNGHAVELPEAGFQIRAGNTELPGKLLNGQALFQMLKDVVVDILYGPDLLAVQIWDPAAPGFESAAGMKQIEQLQNFDGTVVPAVFRRQVIQRQEQRLAP